LAQASLAIGGFALMDSFMDLLDWNTCSYMGLGFALIYRIPQIVRIVQTKKAADLSSYSYITHNGAYVCFIAYLVGTGKTRSEWVLSFYYFMGITQNLLIFALKKYYERQERLKRATESEPHSPELSIPDIDVVVGRSSETDELLAAATPTSYPEADGPANLRQTYARRRRWYKEQGCLLEQRGSGCPGGAAACGNDRVTEL